MHTTMNHWEQHVSPFHPVYDIMALTTFLQDWSRPFGFFNDYFDVRDEAQHLQRTIYGSVGTFIGMWYV